MTLPDTADTDSARGTGAPRRRRSTRLGLIALAAVAALIASAFSVPASANPPPGPHDTFGRVDKITTAVHTGSIRFVGWAADPDTADNVGLAGLRDGKWVVSGVTSIVRPTITAQHHTGATPGFDLSVPVPDTAPHTVCVAVRNVGAGIGRILRCVVTPLGTWLSAQQKSTHSPHGVISAATATSTTMQVSGWASEPDFLSSRLIAVLYVDGQAAATVITYRATAAQRAAGAGKYGAFDVTAPVSAGAHLGCVWFVNTGFGSNGSSGCRAVDTRGGPGSRPVPTPPANTVAVKEALRHIGQPYVWGAAGPNAFDCSGLVSYSYHKAGVTTPRVANAQFAAAHLLPASRAVPGDLVFYHDATGAVYHVGIYLSPGETVAAIDEQEGVAHQTIWDPSSATYGSFTHR